jgi:hypothetical protein
MRKIAPIFILVMVLLICLATPPQTVLAVDVPEATTLTMWIDIKPGGCENPLNVKSRGVLPVAILGTSDLDVTTIDPASIRMVTDPADTDGVRSIRSRVQDVAAPPADVPTCTTTCSDTETGPDGFPDLTLMFKTQDVVELLGDVSDGDCVVLYLKDISGDNLLGQDVVLILKKGKMKFKMK